MDPNEASDLGLYPSLPAYQQQHLQYVAPSAQSSPYPALPGYAQPSPYPSPSVPHYSSSPAPSVPFTNGQSAAAPYYPANSGSGSSAQPSLPPASVSPHAGSAVYASTGGVGSPYPPAAYAANGVPSPASSPQPLSAPASYASPSPSYPGAPSSPAPYPSPNAPTYPAPTSVPYPSGGPYPGAPTSSYPLPGSSPYAPAPTSSAASSSSPSSGYVGPSFTSAAYSSATSPALPPPPPSNYWVTRAAQQPAQPTSRLGLGLDHVDYSDLDPRSMLGTRFLSHFTILARRCITPFRPAPDVIVRPIVPIPPQFQHPRDLGMEEVGNVRRMVADPQTIVDYNTLVTDVRERLSALERESEERRTTCGGCTPRRSWPSSSSRRPSPSSARRASSCARSSRSLASSPGAAAEWTTLRRELHIEQLFGSDEFLYDLLKVMKMDRNSDAHKQYRLPLPIDKLAEYVRRYLVMHYHRQITVITSNIDLPDAYKRKEEVNLTAEWERYSRSIDPLMQLVKNERGEFPFDEP